MYLAHLCLFSFRITQDEAISTNFIHPWSATLNSSIQAAIKSRSIVKSSRISLDACRGTLKSISTGGNAIKLEQGRLDVEAAEEKLVNATEEAINLMRSVLENVSIFHTQPRLWNLTSRSFVSPSRSRTSLPSYKRKELTLVKLHPFSPA